MTVPETGVCNLKRKNEFERKSCDRAFKCDGSKEQGSGLRYRCDRHEECIFPKPEISHEPSLLEYFEKLYGKGKPVSEGRPCCSNLQKKLSIDETGVCNLKHKHEFDSCDRAFKCNGSKEKGSGLRDRCDRPKPEISHEPALVECFDEKLYGKGKPVSEGRPCCSNLQKKLSIDEIGVCNLKHKHEFERKSCDRAFKCDGSKEKGSGLRYQCDRHEECIFLSSMEFLNKECISLFFVEFLKEHCAKGKPCCSDLQKKLSIDEIGVCNLKHKNEFERKNCNRGAFKCDGSKEQGSGLRYRCDRHECIFLSLVESLNKECISLFLVEFLKEHYAKGKPCCSNLQKQQSIDEIGVCNLKHKNEFERKIYDTEFKCDGSKEQGSGLRYRCDRQEECIFPKPEISHEPSLVECFDEKLYGKGKPVSEGRPCCSNLREDLRIDETSVCNCKYKYKYEFESKRRDRSALKCNGCKEKGSGLRYRCDRCGYEFHVECIFSEPEISHEGYLWRFFEEPQPVYVKGKRVSKERLCDACGKDIRGFNYHCKTKGWDLHPCCRNLQLTTSRTEGRRKGKCKYGWVVTLFLNTIRAIFLGDPMGLISQAVIELLTSS